MLLSFILSIKPKIFNISIGSSSLNILSILLLHLLQNVSNFRFLKFCIFYTFTTINFYCIITYKCEKKFSLIDLIHLFNFFFAFVLKIDNQFLIFFMVSSFDSLHFSFSFIVMMMNFVDYFKNVKFRVI